MVLDINYHFACLKSIYSILDKYFSKKWCFFLKKTIKSSFEIIATKLNYKFILNCYKCLSRKSCKIIMYFLLKQCLKWCFISNCIYRIPTITIDNLGHIKL
ncbi:hypothetical protein KUTeg_003596 [Tegillarca granosa]|uniref:Uncharacterized protein n=1 Tax=Tegillarca granosa TaxID=220873 RepID=A0ABQ9FQG4_TEGGR|nr:hypothetical protein KUTeg_003596 [Tegillarca granosa]